MRSVPPLPPHPPPTLLTRTPAQLCARTHWRVSACLAHSRASLPVHTQLPRVPLLPRPRQSGEGVSWQLPGLFRSPRLSVQIAELKLARAASGPVVRRHAPVACLLLSPPPPPRPPARALPPTTHTTTHAHTRVPPYPSSFAHLHFARRGMPRSASGHGLQRLNPTTPLGSARGPRAGCGGWAHGRRCCIWKGPGVCAATAQSVS